MLVVDDQSGIRTLLYEVLSSAGYQVHTAASGREALDMFDEQMFQLLIMDYNLPGLTGVEVVENLEKQSRTLPVILISGLAERLSDQTSRHSMIKHVLSKPFDLEDLTKLVQAILFT